jgi:AcrR family transcriptional regulator
MGRPRGFDEEAGLEAAMRVFWEKSYEGTTIAELTEAMGINRSSMNAAFGDKESIFHRVMQRYRRRRMTGGTIATEEDTKTPRIMNILALMSIPALNTES